MTNPITQEWLSTELQRSALAAEVTLPGDQYRALVEMALTAEKWQERARAAAIRDDRATAALNAQGCKLVDGVWMKPCKLMHDYVSGCDLSTRDNPNAHCRKCDCGGSGWLPITPPAPVAESAEPKNCQRCGSSEVHGHAPHDAPCGNSSCVLCYYDDESEKPAPVAPPSPKEGEK